MSDYKFAVIPVVVAMAMSVTVANATPNTADEDDSVYQWGRWEVLSPAAGEQPVAQIPQQFSQLDTEDYERQIRRVNVREDVEPLPEQPIPVLGLCDAGAACGFATRNSGSSEPPTTGEGTALNTFKLTAASDAYQFTLNEGEEDQIDSAVMDDVQGNRLRQATSSDDLSGIVLSIFDDPARGYWDHADETGYLVYATALPEDVLAGLDGIGEFQGPMWGNPNVIADITVNFGGFVWDGDWSGEHNFGASGSVVGANLVTETLTNAEGFVGGFVGGTADDKVLVIGVDVMTEGNQYTDVGLIPEALPN